MNPDNTPKPNLGLRQNDANAVALVSPGCEIIKVYNGAHCSRDRRDQILSDAWELIAPPNYHAAGVPMPRAVIEAEAKGYRVVFASVSIAQPNNLFLILDEIVKERARADEKWGGSEHDDDKTLDDWHSTISDYNGWARRMACMGSPEKARRRYLQLAALAVAAVQSIDRCLEGQPTQEVE